MTHQLALLYRTCAEEDEGETVLAVKIPNVQQQVGIDDLSFYQIQAPPDPHAVLLQHGEQMLSQIFHSHSN